MAKEARPSPKQQQPPSGERRRAALARRLSAVPAWVKAHPRRASLAALVGAAALIGAAVGLTLVFRGPDRPAYLRQLGQALARLDAGELHEARLLAAGLLTDPAVDYGEQGGAYFILGAVTAAEANEQSSTSQRRLLALVAARYFDEAHRRGIPEARLRDALVAWGRALHTARRFEPSVPILAQALELAPQQPPLRLLLADSLAKTKPPRLAEALAQIRLYLQSPDLSPSERDDGQLAQSGILLAQGDFAAALQTAGAVGPSSPRHPQAVVLKGRIWLEARRRSAADAATDSVAALAALEQELDQLLAREGLPPAVAAQAQLLTAIVSGEQGHTERATSQLDRVRKAHFGQPEAVAALVLLADSLHATRPLDAAALYKQALAQAGPADVYENIWLPVESFQQRLDVALGNLTKAEQFAAALQLADALESFLGRSAALARRAQIHRAWARRLEELAGPQPASTAELTRAQARQQLRQAGAAGRQLAELRIATRYYLDDLAQAADDLRLGQGYQQAVLVYRDLLREVPREGRPEALAGLGESLLALGRINDCLHVLEECRESYPGHPVTYRARLLASFALQEQGKLAEARELLTDNLYRFSLAPQSSEWRDSLFALGGLLFREALDLECRSRLGGVDQTDPDAQRAGLALLEQCHSTFDDAIRTLSQAVQRYPASPEATLARFRIAQARRHSAKWPRKRRATVTIETSRASLARQMQEHLLAAVDEYNALITQLSQQPDGGHTAAETAVLRNCYFGRADALFDLGRYEEAIEAYSAATNRYQHLPESLEAYVQLASCYRRLDRPGEARGTIEQARVVLQRIRPDADFLRTTRLARQDWDQLLDWLRSI